MNEPFDCVGFMRQRRERIEEEDRGLSWEERQAKTLRLLQGNPLYERLRNRAVSTEPGHFLEQGTASDR